MLILESENNSHFVCVNCQKTHLETVDLGIVGRDSVVYEWRISILTLWNQAGTMAPSDLLLNYLPILVFIVIAGGMSVAMIVASLLAGKRNPDVNKLSAYECGFDAFDDARHKFDVRFYLVAILFIIFDLEVAFLFPWAITLGDIGVFGFWSMVTFLGILTVGFIYEWKKGALDWE